MDVNFPEIYNRGMETALQKNIRRLLVERDLNAYQAAKDAGLGDSFVRDILRGKTKSPSAENLAKLAAVLKASVSDLQADTSRRTMIVTDPDIVEDVAGLTVVSEVNAGNWREVMDLEEHEEKERIAAARDQRFPRAKQYALRVRGDSMDLDYPDGSYVTCVDYWDAGVPIRDGQVLHVERTRAGGQLVEITIKAVETIDGRRYLAPRSRNPKWKPFPIDGEEDTIVTIKGLVTGGWKPSPI